MISLLSLAHPKKKTSPYLMADYIEMLCLCAQDNEITLDDIIEKVFHSAETEAEREAIEQEGASLEDEGMEAAYTDRQRALASDWFRHLAYRSAAFSDFYPFEIGVNSIALKVNACTSRKMQLYLFLLLCSSLRLFSRSDQYYLTSSFETISSAAFQQYLPTFVVHCFGKSGVARTNYPNKLSDAIQVLCRNLSGKLACSPSDFGDKNTGDGGLDIVAWREFEDRLDGKLICFAQCACSTDEWEDKLYDIHPDKWDRKIELQNKPSPFIFIPLFYRKADGEWENLLNIGRGVIVDRLRICKLLAAHLPELKIVEDFLIDSVGVCS